jgi:hypothetical protein
MKLIMRSWSKMMPEELVEGARLHVDVDLLSLSSWLAGVAFSETSNTLLQNNLQRSVFSS